MYYALQYCTHIEDERNILLCTHILFSIQYNFGLNIVKCMSNYKRGLDW
jgi:hypothetical protein